MATPQVTFGQRAAAKTVLHAAKYPHASICGLLMSSSADASDALHVEDALPLFHQSPRGLAPMMEVALTHVSALLRDTELRVVGVYHANERVDDDAVDTFAQRVADKIASNENLAKTLLVTIDNQALGTDDAPKDVFAVRHKGDESDDKWRLVDKNEVDIDNDLSPEALTAMLDRGLHRDLVDFDNHLDRIEADILNVGLNMDIDNVVRAC